MKKSKSNDALVKESPIGRNTQWGKDVLEQIGLARMWTFLS
ncbi:hypothetical protein [Vibrio alfacsensis]